MSETLYIRLGSQAQDAIQWLIWSNQEQEVIASGDLNHANDLSHLTEKALQRKVIGFVPANDIAIKRLKVPGKSARAIQAAAPYMLEDDLAQDVESMFFAYANMSKDNDDNNCFAAAVEREQLSQWTSWLSQANITCKTLIPDVLALPFTENSWSAVTLNNQILLRQGKWQGLVVEANVWSLISRQWQKNDANPTDLDESTLITDTDSEAQSATKSNTQLLTQSNTHSQTPVINAYAALPEIVDITVNSMPEELPLALLAQHVDTRLINLLQGEFQVKEKRSANYSTWVWAATIAGIALLTNVVFKAAELTTLNNQIDSIEKEIVSVYKNTFPQTKNVRIATIKSQLNRKLSEVGGGSSQGNFLTMLNKVEPAFNEVSILKPESMKFDSKRNELRVQAVSSNYQSFEKFKKTLEKQSLKVSQGAQNNIDDQVSGSFTISAKGSR